MSPRRWCAAVATALAVVAGALTITDPAPAQQPGPEFRALVFSKTLGFRHDSIPAGVAAIEQLGAEHGFAVDATEDSSAFTAENLTGYDVVIWLSVTGDVLNAEQQAAFEDYVEEGGGYVGVHGAAFGPSAAEPDWQWYGEMMGAEFANHSAIVPGTMTVNDQAHPSTSGLPRVWERSEEWYNFAASPSGDVHPLITVDEDSYTGGTMGQDHPISWCQRFEKGRSWYTALGHTAETFGEPLFLEHLLGGIEWSAGAASGDCDATVWETFERTALTEDVGEPMSLAVLPNGAVLHTSRRGQLYLWDPETVTTRVVNEIPVYDYNQSGLHNLALDPDFADNRWVYVYYSPANEPGIPQNQSMPTDVPAGVDRDEWVASWTGADRLSRFKWTGEQLDLSSEQLILEVPDLRGFDGHNGADIAFDSQGLLYLTTGDDTYWGASNGYAPIDERPSRNPGLDAQRTSANTNDLRGKLLRIRVDDDGTYSIPDGNLFPEAQDTEDQTRPEIYAMGFRNPFRFTIDPATDAVYLADYGPDARQADPERGPAGIVEWNVITQAGNYGWPYCIGDNTPFVDYDFATGQSGVPFDCDNPVNASPNNTGLQELPAITPAEVWYSYGASAEFPQLGTGGGGAMAGPVYQFDPDNPSLTKFPQYYDDVPLFYEFTRNYIKQFFLDGDDGHGTDVVDIRDFAPGIELVAPIDMDFGPDGSLYVLEYGRGDYSENPEARLSRIDYYGGDSGGRPPVAQASASPSSGPAPLRVAFSSEGSRARGEGAEIASYEWDFGDGATSSEANPSHTYTDPGRYAATLTVTTDAGASARAGVTVTAGNTAPEVELEWPAGGGFFAWGDEVPYAVRVADAEDGSTEAGTIDCDRVTITSSLGHDDHAHPTTTHQGCEGTIPIQADDGHDPGSDLYWVVSASYEDEGGDGAPSLSEDDSAVLQPKLKEAEHYKRIDGPRLYDIPGGGQLVGGIDDGSWISFDPVNLANIDSLTFNVATERVGGRIDVHVDAPDGELVGSAAVPSTGDWYAFEEVEAEISDPGGTHELFLVFRSDTRETGLFNVDWMRANGEGVAVPPADVPYAADDAYTHLGSDTPLVVSAQDGVLANDTGLDDGTLTATKIADPSHGAVTLDADGSFSYQPDEGFVGQDSFTYTASDGTVDSNIATVRITVITRSADDLFPYPGSAVELINHRGLSPGFPENTIAAFGNSIAMGVDAIEIDMRTTSDGEIVILHDATVDRTTDGAGPVNELTLAEVKELDAGSYVSPEFAGERIPTFEETLQVAQGTGVKLLLDIKTSSVTERAVQLAEQYGMVDDVIVGPRTVANLQAFKALNPNLTTLGFIATPADADAMIAAGVDYIRLWPDWIRDSRDSAECRADYAARVAAFEAGERDHPGSASCMLEEVVSQGTPVWSTVNDMPYEGMDEIIQLGATGLLSDLPTELDRLLADIDAERLTAATGQVEELSAALAEDFSPRDLRGGYAAVARARAQLRRAEQQLRRDRRAAACGTLDRVAAILDGSERRADYVWAARETQRILACSGV